MDDFKEVLDKIVQTDPRYDKQAYLFMREALDYTQKAVAKKNRRGIRHVKGQELLEGIREYALDQFGPMTLSVFHEWGIFQCEDFGEIVFNLVEHDLLRKTEEDSREDFQGGYDFYEAFQKPYVPSHKFQTMNGPKQRG